MGKILTSSMHVLYIIKYVRYAKSCMSKTGNTAAMAICSFAYFA